MSACSEHMDVQITFVVLGFAVPAPLVLTVWHPLPHFLFAPPGTIAPGGFPPVWLVHHKQTRHREEMLWKHQQLPRSALLAERFSELLRLL